MVMRITIKLNYIKAKSEGQIHVEFYDLMALFFFSFSFAQLTIKETAALCVWRGRKEKM